MRFLLLALLVLAPQVFAQTAPLNDTGQTQCFDADTSDLAACTPANTGDGSTHPRQDARFGRDAQAGAGDLTKIGAGAAGFDYTKICNSGEPAGTGDCPADPALGADTDQWACTRDNVTGLIWEVKTAANMNQTFTFDNATTFAATAQLCGFDDWRVATRRELLSIVHHGASSPSIDTSFFPNTPGTSYWSSDIYAPNSALAWNLNFNNGSTFANAQTFGLHVRLVRSGQSFDISQPSQMAIPAGDQQSTTAGATTLAAFTVNPDGTVTDPATGLMWDRCSWGQTGTDCSGASASSYNWQPALEIAATANAANHRGHNDWRLPNRTELESLVDITKETGPTINETAFPGTPSARFWSSTVYTPDPAVAWGVSFIVGVTVANSQSDLSHVRLVRSGQYFDALAPTAPTDVTATAGNAQATVSWTAPSDTGGSAITGYSVTSSPDGQTCTSTEETSCTVTGLTNGTEYTFTVISTNAAGNGPASEPSNAVTPATVPAAPTDATATAGNAQATVSWTAPSETGGSAITGYTVTSSPDGQTCTSTEETSCTVTGLTNGTKYTFTVISTNAAGNGPASEPSNAVVPSELLFQDRFDEN